jgi:hypothetical protein
VLIGVAGAGISAHQNAMRFERDVAARSMFLAARAAVMRDGGSIQKLESLVAKGSSRFVGADGSSTTGNVELRVMLPGRYLRIDTVGPQKRAFGFNAGALVNVMSDRGRPLETPERAAPALLERARREFAVFMMGATTYVMNEQPLVFHSIVAGAYAIEPHTLRAVGDRMSFTLFLDPRTRTPRAIGYEQEGGDVSIAFEDRRTVAGLSLPFHMAKKTGGLVVDELAFEQVLVNPPLTAADFTP